MHWLTPRHHVNDTLDWRIQVQVEGYMIRSVAWKVDPCDDCTNNCNYVLWVQNVFTHFH